MGRDIPTRYQFNVNQADSVYPLVHISKYAVAINGEFRIQFAEPGAANSNRRGAGIYAEAGSTGEFRILPINSDQTPSNDEGPLVHTAAGSFLTLDGVFHLVYAEMGAPKSDLPTWLISPEVGGLGEFRFISIDDIGQACQRGGPPGFI